MLMSSKILLFRTYLSSLHLASSAVWSLVHFLSLGDFFASKGSPFQNLLTYTQNHSTTSEFYSDSVSALLKHCLYIWTASSEFGTYSLCEQRRFWRDCADAQARLNLRCSHRR